MTARRPKQYCLQLDIALWCKIQIEHSIWDESLLFCNCACSLEYSSLNTLAGLSYHICGKLEVAFKASPSSKHQHCTDKAQDFCLTFSAGQYFLGCGVETFQSFLCPFNMSQLFPKSILLHLPSEIYLRRRVGNCTPC